MADQGSKQPASASFEDFPLTRSEYINTMIHFYRGEMGRANVWRTRLDTTSNWAIVGTAGMLSIAFNQAEHSHVTLLLANLMVTIFLGFEARRFRYFDVWRARIRMIEENFLVPMLRRNLISPRDHWRDFVAEDLDTPTFKITYLQAMAMRLRRNFIWLYAVILVAWLAKLNVHPTMATSLSQVIERMAIGSLPGVIVLLGVAIFFAGVVAMALSVGHKRGGSDEVHGIEKAIDHWKA